MRLLVVGGDRVDAGKTTFSVGLLARTGGVGFKPRAGNDYWYDHDDVRRAIAEERLYGKDAKRLADASAGDVTPEAVNPIHRLWRPAPGPGGGLLGPADREFVCDRVAGSFVRNGHAEVPRPVRERLPVEDAVVVDSVAELNEVTERRHLPATTAVARRIAATDPAVVEAYGDVALPLEGVPEEVLPAERYDAVAVVEPSRARVYDGDRFVRAASVAAGSPRDGRLERRVGDVLDPLDPVTRVTLPALGDDDRADPATVADAYAEAYDALLAAV